MGIKVPEDKKTEDDKHKYIRGICWKHIKNNAEAKGDCLDLYNAIKADCTKFNEELLKKTAVDDKAIEEALKVEPVTSAVTATV